MTYALLWLEALVTAALWTATLYPSASTMRWTWGRRITLFAAVGIPLLTFTLLAVLSGFLKFSIHFVHHWFGYFLALLLAYIAVAIFIFIRGGRHKMRSEGEGSSWSSARLAIAMVTALAVTAMTMWNMDLEVRQRAQSLQNEAGAILIAASPPQLNDSENAALVYEKAFARLKEEQNLTGEKSPLDTHPQYEIDPLTATILKRNVVTLRLLRNAAKLRHGRFDHDYAHPSAMMLLPELSQFRKAALLLELDARFECARGNVDVAIGDVDVIFRLSETAGEEPFLVCSLVAAALDNIGCEALEEVLQAVDKPEQLSSIQLGDASFETHIIKRGLDGADALGLAEFSDVANDRISLLMLAAICGEGQRQNVSSYDFYPLRILSRIYLLPDDIDSHRELFEKLRGWVARPYFQRPSEAEESEALRRCGFITSMISPAVLRVWKSLAQCQAEHSCAEVGVAMTHYRLEHSGFPVSLDQLVPDYLDEIPTDPFDGNPLRLVHKNDAWIVYSVGPDAKDDGGAPYDSTAGTGDITFTLKLSK